MKPFVLSCTAALLFVGSASATPVKRLAWVKAEAQWGTLAKARGAAMSCSAWTATGPTPTCTFTVNGAEWRVALYPTSDPCAITVTVYKPAGAPFPRTLRTDVALCKAGWQKTLQAPWTP